MRPSDHHLMKETVLRSRDEAYLTAVVRNLTYANVVTLLVWSVWSAALSRFDLWLWLRLLACACVFFLSGWAADRLWYRLIAGRLEKPFAMKAYTSRVPFHFAITGSTATAAAIWILPEWSGSFFTQFLIAGSIACVVQVPLQLLTFNRLRKTALTEL